MDDDNAYCPSVDGVFLACHYRYVKLLVTGNVTHPSPRGVVFAVSVETPMHLRMSIKQNTVLSSPIETYYVEYDSPMKTVCSHTP